MMNRTVPFLLLLCLGPICKAQTSPEALAPQPDPAAVSPELVSLISASSKVPPVCIQKIMTDPERSASFLSNQLCAEYLALSSNQYQTFKKGNRGRFAESLFANAGVQAAAIQAFKSLSQQTGSSAGTGGSTNLTAKGLTAQFLSLASEYGALTESTSGQTTTLAGTLAGVPLVFLKNSSIQSCPTNLYGFNNTNPHCVSPGLVENLSRISYSVSVNSNTANHAQSATVNTTSSSNAVPATFSNNSSDLKVTAISGKWIALQGKPSSDTIANTYEQFMKTGDQTTAHRFASDIESRQIDHTGQSSPQCSQLMANIRSKVQDHIQAFTQAETEAVVNLWKSYATCEVASLGIPDSGAPLDAASEKLLSEIQEFALLYAQSIAQMQAAGLAMARPAILTFEFDNNRPLNQPSNSVFRVIYQAKLGHVTLTANGAASIYDSTPPSSIPGAERLRDIQIAAQADRPFSIKLFADKKIDMTGSGSFYFQDQTSPSILNITPGMPVSGVSFTGLPSTATQVFAQKGNIAIGQAKLTLGSGSNLKVPISVTYSNRTELVTSPTWRGQIGISYDFDSLFTKK